MDGARKRPLATVSGAECDSMTLLDDRHTKSRYALNVGRVYLQILTSH
nr:MAG TPA: peptidyl-prolyl cis-transisomerase [Caudoviricetes sp.]